MLAKFFALFLISIPAHASTADFAVKVESSFRRGSETKLEGTGILLHQNGKWIVYTSEHVVIRPSKKGDGSYKITMLKGAALDAKFIESDWEHGLALLEVIGTPPDLGTGEFPLNAETCFKDSSTELQRKLFNYGYPSGSNEEFFSIGSHEGIAPAGMVLASQHVLLAKGLRPEFGMSGGPVYAQDGKNFYGLVSHITYEEDAQTFVIPACDIVAWGEQVRTGSLTSDFERAQEDSQLLLLSKVKPEILHLRNSDITLEKRKGQFLVKVPPIDAAHPYHPTHSHPGFDLLVHDMSKMRVVMREIFPNSSHLSLSQVVHQLMLNELPPIREMWMGNAR